MVVDQKHGKMLEKSKEPWVKMSHTQVVRKHKSVEITCDSGKHHSLNSKYRTYEAAELSTDVPSVEMSTGRVKNLGPYA